MSGFDTLTEQEQAVLSGAPGFCRAIDPTGTFICALPVKHDGDHEGFEMPTIEIDDPAWEAGR